jgi:type IV pilus assembly protein PilW
MKRIASRGAAAGFTLIEMMVALVVGLVVIGSVVAVQKAFEGQRRTSTSSNDLDNAGAYVLSQIDGMVRSAGSGFSQKYAQTYGCELYATSGGTTLLPAAAAFPAPFENVLGSAGISNSLGGILRMAPVLILPHNTTSTLLNGTNSYSDVLMVMGGTGSAANLPTPFAGDPTSTTLAIQNAAGFNPSDLVLIADTPQSGGMAPCLIDQLASGTISTTETFNSSGSSSVTVNLGGTMYATPLMGAHSFGIDATAVSMGNINGNYPTFRLVGVGANNQLMSYDLLNLTGSSALPIGDSVIEMHALYLVNSAGGSGYVGVDPFVTAAYNPANLMAGTAAAAGVLKQITGIRIGLILKSPLLERLIVSGGSWTHVAPATLTLFNDPNLVDAGGNPLTLTRTLDAAGVCAASTSSTTNPGGNAPSASCERDYRYRTVELTIPLRNNMLLN